MPNPLIVSASNDAYLDLLDGMLGSIGGRLADFDLGIIDLGLSDAGKDRIRARKTGVHFARAEWRRTFPGIDKAPEYKKVFVSKPFIPDIFPGYEDYVWVDADIWFQDAGAIDDYVEAGNTRGGQHSVSSRTRPICLKESEGWRSSARSSSRASKATS